jgi:hypothetical protein
MNLDDVTSTEPIPFDDYDYYHETDIDYDDSLPPFKMSPESSDLSPYRYKKTMNILSYSDDYGEDSYSDEGELEPEKPKYGDLDVISLNQSNKKLDIMSQIYFGSLTMVGLFILFRYLKK